MALDATLCADDPQRMRGMRCFDASASRHDARERVREAAASQSTRVRA